MEKLEVDQWYEGPFTVLLSRKMPKATIRRMKTAGQVLKGWRIYVHHGKARDTRCGGLEFRDSHNIPFYWNKKLVIEVSRGGGQSRAQSILWVNI